MADQRKVGHAIRRRMGASSSHLGMAGGPSGSWSPPPSGDAALSSAETTARGNVQIPSGAQPMSTSGRAKGVPAQYPTASKPPLAGDNASFASGVASGVQGEPHPARKNVESSGARLTVSPSMKVPQESPVPTQGTGRVVPSTPGRQSSFSEGQAGAYSG